MFLIILGIITGIVFYKILSIPYKKIKQWWSFLSIILKNYWTFIIIFAFCLVVSYYSVFKIVPTDKINIALTIIGQCAALIFAIFIGYFSFLQVIKSNIEGKKQEAYLCFKNKYYNKAIKLYEEICAVENKDFSFRANLLELYLIQGDLYRFDKNILYLEKNFLDIADALIINYLKSTRALIDGNLRNSRQPIKELIKLKQNNPVSKWWDFNDFKSGPSYKFMEESCKIKFNDLIKYLDNLTSKEEQLKFEIDNNEKIQYASSQ